MNARPSVREERAIALAKRAVRWERERLVTPSEKDAIATTATTRWVGQRLVVRAGLFLLVMLMALAAVALAFLTERGLAAGAGVAALAAGEIAVRKFRLLRSGIEEGLFAAGSLLIAVGVVPESEPSHALVIGGGVLLAAAWRLVSGWLAAAGAGLLLVWLVIQFETGPTGGWLFIAVGTVAAVIGARRLARPSVDQTFSLLVVAAPVGMALLLGDGAGMVTLVALFAAAIVMVVIGWVSRRHPALLAGLTGIALAGGDLVTRLPVDAEWILLGAGALLLGAAVTIDRICRDRASGVTSSRWETDGDLSALGEIAAAATAMPHRVDEDAAQGGGRFGGGGASADF